MPPRGQNQGGFGGRKQQQNKGKNKNKNKKRGAVCYPGGVEEETAHIEELEQRCVAEAPARGRLAYDTSSAAAYDANPARCGGEADVARMQRLEQRRR